MKNDKKLVQDITSMDVDFAKWYTDICKKAKGNVVEIPKVVDNNYIVKGIIRENKDGDGWVYAKYKINVNKDFIERVIQALNEY